MTEQRKAWQEPMVWLMVGIPALTVVAGIATLIIAIQSGPMDSVSADVARIGKAQTLDSTEDRAAAEGNYRAYLIIDKSKQPWSISIKSIPMALSKQDMHLFFVHPNRAKLDIDVLIPANVGDVDMLEPMDFEPQQIILSDSQKTWRLVGQYLSDSTITLTPAQPAQ